MRSARLAASLLVAHALASGPGAAAGEPRPAAGTGTVKLERIPYQGWFEAYRWTNGNVEVVVVPAAARIMRYGFVGESNLLWENPDLAGRAPTRGEWSNYGGDKIWIWPQDEWLERTGSGWPPPTDQPEVIAQTAEVAGPGTLRLTSREIPGFGLRTIRELRLEPSGSRLHLSSRIESLTGGPSRVAVWTVTQVPADGRIFARLVPGARAEQSLSGAAEFARLTRIGADVLQLERPTAHSAKLGLDADLLAWQRGELLFVQRAVDPGWRPEEFSAGERAQVFSARDGDPALPPAVSYVELELTSPLRTLREGETVSLEVVWELLRLDPGETTPEAIAAKLR